MGFDTPPQEQSRRIEEVAIHPPPLSSMRRLRAEREEQDVEAIKKKGTKPKLIKTKERWMRKETTTNHHNDNVQLEQTG